MFKAKFNLIITIVNEGGSDTVIEAAKAAGARGATVIKGHGSKTKDIMMLFEVPIVPEKDIVLCIVPENITQDVMENITRNANLEKTGAGISFSTPLNNIVGIVRGDENKSDLD